MIKCESASKKSLANVLVSCNCHPSMAMMIDDRLKVWEDRNQSHVHVVPAFAPYYDPLAEMHKFWYKKLSSGVLYI